MKNLFLLILSWGMLISPLAAQKSLAPGIQPYAVNWSYAVKQMLNAGGYNVPGPKAAFDLRPGSRGPSNDVVLDSTITFYGYNLGAGEPIPLFRNIYTYPEPGAEVVEEFFFERKAWVSLSRTTLVVDHLGRMTEATAQRYDEESGQFIPDSRIDFFPRGSDLVNIDSFFISAWSTELNGYIRQMATWNTYDVHERLTESVSAIEIFEYPLIFTDQYTYDIAGHLVLVESFNIDGIDPIPAGKQELVYEDGHLIRVTDFDADGLGAYVPRHKSVLTYHLHGAIHTDKSYDWDFEQEDWILVQDKSYGYDGDGRITSQIIIISNQEGIMQKDQTTYSYTLDAYPALETNYTWNEAIQDYTVVQQKHFYYNTIVAYEPVDPVDPVVADALFMYPNPTSGVVQVKLVGKISVQIYTISGQLVNKYTLSPGEKFLDLSDLPSGIYQVRAKSDDDYFSGKLLVQ